MIELPNYSIVSQIYESANSLVYRAIRKEDEQPVILKVLKENYPSRSELTRYKQEYEITRNLKIEGVVKAYSLEIYQRTLAIVLEDFGGSSLRQLRNQGDRALFCLEEFLAIALKIAEILGQIHAANIIHKDINPSNIVLNPQSGQLKIIDFGISTQLTRENPTLKNPNVLEGTLAYMSPEQTGRMNRSLDYRSDFYSLGVTFYELLTQKLPFETDDALELVHCHIAKLPVPPYQVNPEIPPVLSNIVMKMMAKTAEERYQSAWGIKADLEECQTQLQTKGNISAFPLASKDISDKFQIPQKLYGREAEVETLLAAFDRVADNPQSKIEMMLVAGYSGIGKSSLIAEIHKPNTRLRGYFISGKFDQFQRNIPYSAVVGAFKDLVRQLLTESESQLYQWREKLLAAFGRNGQVIIDVIPEVELIVGKQPPVPSLGPAESQNRFNLVFQNFIRAFCSKEHPLVIFLDDLQWADSATLKLIELMMTDTDIQYLFLIGAYRDNEVSPTHPLMMMLAGLRKQGATINFITLTPLELEHTTRLIADTLHSDADLAQPLAELVMKKTLGNPFFVNQFLKTLHAENFISFDLQRYVWQWHISNIEAQNITDNVVELTIGKLKKLPESTQQVLRLAACVGASFDLDTLSIICEKSKPAIFKDLVTAVQSGLILPTSELDAELLIQTYKFLHDRVQQAAYALIDDKNKKLVHLQIGRLILQNTSAENLSEEIFEIVDHFNQGVEIVTDPEERSQIAKLNLMAGQKAKAATAYAAAAEYLTVGMKVLPTDSWNAQYELTLDFYRQRAEIDYLNGNLKNSETLINRALSFANSDREKAELYKILVMQFTLQLKYSDAIEVGSNALRLLGIDVPQKDLETALDRELAEAKKNIGDRDINALLDAPEMAVKEKKEAMKLFNYLGPPTYLFCQPLFNLFACKAVNLSLEYGPVAECGYLFACYGIFISTLSLDYKTAYEISILGLRLSERFNNKVQQTSALEVLIGHISHWRKALSLSHQLTLDAYQAGLESGEIQFASFSIMWQSLNRFYQGYNLEEYAKELDNYLLFVQKIKHQVSQDVLLGCQLTVAALSGIDVTHYGTDEFQHFEDCKARKSSTFTCPYLTLKSQILYLFDRLKEALDCALEAEKFLGEIPGVISVAEQNFYGSLILTALYPSVSETERENYRLKLEIHQSKMKIWADNCAENFLHKYLLVEAEMDRIAGKDFEACDLYDRAIESARENGFIQNEALGNELAAKFWLAKGKKQFAQLYMKKAQYAYQLWGAKRKVEDLEEKYPQLLTKFSAAKTITDTPTTTTSISTNSRSGEALDLASVMKAAQAISGEIVLDKLLQNLMKILIENAGAQLGYLILESEGNLLIEVSGKVDDDSLRDSSPMGHSFAKAKPGATGLYASCVTAFQPIPIDNRLPVSLINYVVRSQESVVENEASRAGRFTNDPYIKERQCKSILCMPLIKGGKLISIVYLENNLIAGAFTPDRLEVLKILSSQAAISIENARLYQTLEDKVKERTAQLAQANHQLAQANQDISALNELLKEENLRMRAELEVTKQLQQMILPKTEELASIEGLEIAGFMEPADEVGGDYYDVLQQDGKVKIGIGDVTGHGLESGVLMLMTQTAVRTLQESNQTDPVKFLEILNRTIYRNAQRINPYRNMTLNLLDYAEGTLRVSGQHEEIIVVRAGGELERIDTRYLGFPIALEEEIADFIDSKQVQLNSGDVVVLYTDGVTEAFDRDRVQYGLERLCEVVKNNCSVSAEGIRQAIIEDVRRHIGDQKLFDDITLVVLKQK